MAKRQSTDIELDQLAIEHASTEPTYALMDAEAQEPIAQITEFQLQYLKTIIPIPKTDAEGWYFHRMLFSRLEEHIAYLSNRSTDASTKLNEIERAKRFIDEYDPEEDDEDLDLDQIEEYMEYAEYEETDLEPLRQEAAIFLRKSVELRQLHERLQALLQDYDAVEVTWHLLKRTQNKLIP